MEIAQSWELDEDWVVTAFAEAREVASQQKRQSQAKSDSPKIPTTAKPAKPSVIIKPAAPKIEPLKLRLWSEVRVPDGANDLEKLTYVPGLVGDITEWIVNGARRPNRVMALGVATVVVGTIVGRLIKGPTGSGTHLYIINLAPTGCGKDWPLQGGAMLMDAAGLSHLIGPDEF